MSNLALGVNLPPIIGKTFDLRIEKHLSHKFSTQIGFGYMHNNTIEGSLHKDDDGFNKRISSGYFATLGARFHTRKSMDKSTVFFGAKYIAGHFHQRGELWRLEPDLESDGFYNSIGIEVGSSIKIKPRIWVDLGAQFSFLLKDVPNLSEHFTIPGMGAIGDLQGIVSLKYFVFQE